MPTTVADPQKDVRTSGDSGALHGAASGTTSGPKPSLEKVRAMKMFKNIQETNGNGTEHTRSASTMSHRKAESVGPHEAPIDDVSAVRRIPSCL